MFIWKKGLSHIFTKPKALNTKTKGEKRRIGDGENSYGFGELALFFTQVGNPFSRTK